MGDDKPPDDGALSFCGANCGSDLAVNDMTLEGSSSGGGSEG